MPGLTKNSATQTVTDKRNGRQFDEISDAVDEGWCSTPMLLTAGPQTSDVPP